MTHSACLQGLHDYSLYYQILSGFQQQTLQEEGRQKLVGSSSVKSTVFSYLSMEGALCSPWRYFWLHRCCRSSTRWFLTKSSSFLSPHHYSSKHKATSPYLFLHGLQDHHWLRASFLNRFWRHSQATWRFSWHQKRPNSAHYWLQLIPYKILLNAAMFTNLHQAKLAKECGNQYRVDQYIQCLLLEQQEKKPTQMDRMPCLTHIRCEKMSCQCEQTAYRALTVPSKSTADHCVSFSPFFSDLGTFLTESLTTSGFPGH